MRHPIFLLSILVLLNQQILKPACADDRIEPFGQFAWTDTVVDVVIKLNSIESVTDVYIQDISGGTINLKNLGDAPQIMSVIHTFLRRKPRRYFQGVDEKIVRETFIVNAQPLLIHGVGFSAHIAYSSSLSMMQKYPDKVSHFVVANDKHYVPLRMTHFVLSKIASSRFNRATLKKFQDFVAEKYSRFPSFRVWQDEVRVRDEAGRSFFARWKASEILGDIVKGYTGSCILQYSNRS